MDVTAVRRLSDRYLVARGIAATTLGRKAVQNSSVLHRLNSGQVTVRTVRRLVQYLSDHWPTDLAWPEDIARPSPRPAARADSGAETHSVSLEVR